MIQISPLHLFEQLNIYIFLNYEIWLTCWYKTHWNTESFVPKRKLPYIFFFFTQDEKKYPNFLFFIE